jgi:hypothetical protein
MAKYREELYKYFAGWQGKVFQSFQRQIKPQDMSNAERESDGFEQEQTEQGKNGSGRFWDLPSGWNFYKGRILQIPDFGERDDVLSRVQNKTGIGLRLRIDCFEE